MRLLLVGYAAFLAASHGPAPALAAPMAEHFSRADVDAYVEAAVRTLGDSESTTADRDYAVRLLGVLDNPSVASGYKSSACSAASTGLLSGDLEQIHHGISLASGVGGCTNAKTSTASEEVRAAMQERHDLESLYHATLAAPLLGVDQGTGGVLDKVLDLVNPDGSVRGYPGGPVEDGNAFMAAGLLAALVPSAEDVAQNIALRTVDMLKDGVLASEPSLLVQLNRAHGSKFFVKATKLKAMARNLLEASHTDSPKGMLAAYEAIKAIESYDNAPFPVKLVPTSPSVKEMASGDVGLLVTSLLGTPASVKSAVLSKLTRPDGSNALSGSAAATKGGSPLGAPNADGLRALPAASVAAGLYTAEFSVKLEGVEEGKALTAKIPLAVGTAVKLARTRVSVSASKVAPTVSLASLSTTDDDDDEEEDGGGDGDDAGGVGVANYLLSPGKTLPGRAQASTLDGHHLHVRLALSGGDAAAASAAAATAPHQVFVRFTHALTGLDTFFVAAPVETGGGGGVSGEFLVSVSLGEESATFLQRSGAYELAVLVGGPLVSPPVLEQLGVIDLDFPVTKARNWPLYARALLHETDVALGPLPEKHHTFREPEVRPHAGVSLLFTLLVLAPLAGLVRGMRLGGADLRRLPRSTSGRTWCALYQACMVSVVVLFATYWAALTMAYTLRVLAVLSLATTVTGRKALQSIALEEEEQKKNGENKGSASSSNSSSNSNSGGSGSSGSGSGSGISHTKAE